MGQVGDLIGAQGAAAAGVLRPAEHPGLEEGAIDDQLPAALEQVEQAYLALGPLELVRLFDGHPRHPPAFGGHGVAGAASRPSPSRASAGARPPSPAGDTIGGVRMAGCSPFLWLSDVLVVVITVSKLYDLAFVQTY